VSTTSPATDRRIERLARSTGRPAPPPSPAVADDRICWTTVAGLSVIHLGAAVGVVWVFARPSWATLVLAVTLYAVCGLSMTAGYHRLFAHRTYRATAPVRWALLLGGAAMFQNSALSWSADHRAHHADTDGVGDPHAITRGAYHAHLGWLLRRRTASADVSRLGDLWAIRSIRLQHRWYAAIAIGTGLVLPMALAWTWGDVWGGLFVAGFLRAGVMMQTTFCINSLAHLVGIRRYDARSTARDFTPTALITFGEGYHSFHHRFPFDYRSSPIWWHYDPNKWLVWSLARAHLVDTVRTASPGSIARAVASAQPGPAPPAARRDVTDRPVASSAGEGE
jgi:stearoyl-CoA desaturase (delta-9 desaturase)